MFAIGDAKWAGLSKVIEECGEVLQLAGKLIATGGETKHFDPALRPLDELLCEELADLYAAVLFFAKENLTPAQEVSFAKRARKKLDQFQEWHGASAKEDGALAYAIDNSLLPDEDKMRRELQALRIEVDILRTREMLRANGGVSP